MNGFIYKITNDINDKVYIGKTLQSSVEKRFLEHKKDSKRQHMENRPLYRAMNKYGDEHFYIEQIEEVPISELSQREQYWISIYQSYENGYNATKGGDGKQLYDYNEIVQEFLSGKLMKDLAVEFECSIDTIAAAIQLAHLDPRLNADKKATKKIVAKSMAGDIIEIFDSRKDAVQWLQKHNYTKSTNRDNIIATIGRVANGRRKSAYGLKWENI